jgi:hypothetical protein
VDSEYELRDTHNIAHHFPGNNDNVNTLDFYSGQLPLLADKMIAGSWEEIVESIQSFVSELEDKLELLERVLDGAGASLTGNINNSASWTGQGPR